MIRAVIFGLAAAFALATPVPATAQARKAAAPTAAPVRPPAPVDEVYRLQPGDVIDVKFFFNPELNESLAVRPDGRVSLQLVTDAQAAGRTPTELRAELMKRYADTLKQPELAVIVREVAPRRIYVGGEVRNPSLLRIDGRVSLLQALFEAGGVTRAGKTSDVVVLRYRGTDAPEFIKVDLRPALERGDGRGDLQLQPFDIIWVPKTKIAKVNDFMDQYVRQLTPVPLTLGITYVWGGLVP